MEILFQTDRATERRRNLRRLFVVLAPVVAVLAVLFFVFDAPATLSSHRAAVALAAVQPCTSGAASSTDCVVTRTATVSGTSHVKEYKDDGNAEVIHVAYGATGFADLYIAGGLVDDVSQGDTVSVEIWNGTPIAMVFDGRTSALASRPGADASENAIDEMLATLLAVVLGRAVIWLWAGRRVNRDRFLLADLLLVPFLFGTVVLGAGDDVVALLVTGGATLFVLVLSCAAWPFVPWVRRAPARPSAAGYPFPR